MLQCPKAREILEIEHIATISKNTQVGSKCTLSSSVEKDCMATLRLIDRIQ